MLRTNKISRRSALKSLFIVSALPTVFISSCTKSITSPETSQEGNSKLYKSHFDSDIALLENLRVVTNSDGIAEIPKKYLHTGKNKKGGAYVLTREGESDFALIFRKLEIVNKTKNKKIFKVRGLSDGTVIMAKPIQVLKSLKKTNNHELKRKFAAGTKKKRGGIK